MEAEATVKEKVEAEAQAVCRWGRSGSEDKRGAIDRRISAAKMAELEIPSLHRSGSFQTNNQELSFRLSLMSNNHRLSNDR